MPRIKRVIDEVEKRWLGGANFPPSNPLTENVS